MAISDKNDRLTIIIPKNMKEQLRILAEHRNRSLSNYIVTILDDYIIKEIDQLEKYGHFDVYDKIAESTNKYNDN